jgi:hypothetical protein
MIRTTNREMKTGPACLNLFLGNVSAGASVVAGPPVVAGPQSWVEQEEPKLALWEHEK